MAENQYANKHFGSRPIPFLNVTSHLFACPETFAGKIAFSFEMNLKPTAPITPSLPLIIREID